MMYLLGYKKALKVIESCENELHLIAAQKYCNNFFKVNAKKEPMNRYGKDIFNIDPFYASAYERLLKKIHLKRQSF